MDILVGRKFTSKHLDNIINKYWEDSFKSPKVIFNLSKTEWAAAQELTFLYAWIIKLKRENKTCDIRFIMPSASPLDDGEVKYFQKIQNKHVSYHNFLARRGFFQKHLWKEWNPIALIGLSEQSFANIIIPESTDYKSHDRAIKIVSFNKLTASATDSAIYQKIDLPSVPSSIISAFHLEENVRDVLQKESAFDPFDSRVLSHVVVKELFLNTIHHAFPKEEEKAAYLSINLTKNVSHYENEKQLYKILLSRISERCREERDFYFTSTNKDGNHAILSNKSYLELTYIDLGEGIPNTLKHQYYGERDIIDNSQFGEMHTCQNEDTKIIEYAFLLHTSRFPFEESLKINNFVPRGLYFIKEVVSRYGGMIIARSRKGKVVYDYTCDKLVKYSYNDKYLPDFPGTMISIILPTGKKASRIPVSTNRSKIVNKSNSPRKKCYFHLESDIWADLSINQKNNISGYNYVFKYLNDRLDNENEPVTFYVDFAGVDFLENSYAYKIFYYLVNTPKINNNKNFIILNTADKNIIRQIQENIILSEDFLFRPIPCLHVDLTANWIGIKYIEDEQKLNEIWTIPEKSFSTMDFNDVDSLSGNMINVEWIKDDHYKRGNVCVSLPNISNIAQIILENSSKRLNSEINKISVKNDDGRLFLTSSGYYQTQYITFLEVLYNRPYTLQLAANLLTKYFIYNKNEPINIIITVSLSAQLLGEAIYNLLELLKPWGNEHKIDLVCLSNYYDFSSEQSFNEMRKKSNLNAVFITDVISSGTLFNNIVKLSVPVKIRTALTILDCRTDVEIDVKKDIAILALNNNIKIDKLDNNNTPKPPIWINPILNIPISIKRESLDFENVLLDINEFLSYKDYTEHLLIGHINHNMVHYSYFVKTSLLFDTDIGISIVKDIINKFKNKLLLKSDVLIREKLNKQKEDITEISNYLPDALKAKYQKCFSQFNSIVNFYQQGNFIFDDNKLTIDYVFVPLFSNANLLKNILKSYFDSDLYFIPRVMTPRGWRFAFLPKTISDEVKGKTVLLFDDGTSTGDTLKQMIDTICQSNINKIYVLSVVNRLEDFNREFYSRIQEMKTLYQYEGRAIPINIYFGVNLHIPMFSTNTQICPFCLERELIEKEMTLSHPKRITPYMETRRTQLKDYGPKELDKDYRPEYFPNNIDICKLYKIRDFIGRFDSYRLYEEDNPYELDSLLNDMNGYEYLLCVILHEPHLIFVIKRFYPEKISQLDVILMNHINNKILLKNIWPKDSIIVLLKHIKGKIFYSYETLIKVLNFVKDDTKGTLACAYLIWQQMSPHIKKSDQLVEPNDLYFNVNKIIDKFKKDNIIDKNKEDIFRDLLYWFTTHEKLYFGSEEEKFLKAYYRLYEFYEKEAHEIHAARTLESSVNKVIIDIQSRYDPNIDLRKNWQEDLSKKLTDILSNTEVIKNILLIYSNDIYNIMYGNDSSVERIYDIINDTLKNNIKEDEVEKVISSLKCLNENIAYINSPCSKYFRDFISNPQDSFDEARRIVRNRYKNIQKSHNSIEGGVVAVQRKLLDRVFEEFINNLRHVEKAIDCTYEWNTDEKYISLIFIEHTVKKIFDRGFGLEMIGEVLKYFNGNFTIDTSEEDKVKFIFKFRKALYEKR